MDECIFCRIVAGATPAYIIHEDDQTIIFLSLENHPLIVPKAHISDIFALDDATAAAVMQLATWMARALRDALGCDGVLLTQANGATAGQDVFHFHLHLYPRWHGDGGRVAMPMPDSSASARAARRDQLRAALGRDVSGG